MLIGRNDLEMLFPLAPKLDGFSTAFGGARGNVIAISRNVSDQRDMEFLMARKATVRKAIHPSPLHRFIRGDNQV